MGSVVWLLLHCLWWVKITSLYSWVSDNDFDVGEPEYECDTPDREQGKQTIRETFYLALQVHLLHISGFATVVT